MVTSSVKEHYFPSQHIFISGKTVNISNLKHTLRSYLLIVTEMYSPYLQKYPDCCKIASKKSELMRKCIRFKAWNTTNHQEQCEEGEAASSGGGSRKMSQQTGKTVAAWGPSTVEAGEEKVKMDLACSVVGVKNQNKSGFSFTNCRNSDSTFFIIIL